MTREQKIEAVAKRVVEGGWSSIYTLVEQMTDEELNDRLGIEEPEFPEATGSEVNLG